MAKEPISRNFNSPEEMAAHAEASYKINKKAINQIELDAGFDISNLNSVMEFKIMYAPIGNTVLLKEIPKELIEENPEKLLVVDLSNTSTKYYVMVPGLIITTLQRGDIITLNPPQQGDSVKGVIRTFNGVRFLELDYYHIGGIYMDREKLLERVAESDKLARLKRNE